MGRREFVRRSALGALGAGLAGAGIARAVGEGAEAQAAPTIPKRVLGRTGLEVPEISFGSFGFENGDLLSSALDAGMNLVDTAPSYGEGAAERAIGRVMATRRKDAVLMTKWNVNPASSKQQLLDSLAGSLERLQTDHVDIVHVGLAESVDQLRNPAVFEAFGEAKAAGKVRFLGVSTHAGSRADICQAAIDDGRFDMLCLKHNFGEAAVTEGVLAKAKEKNLGVVAFKVTAGAKPEDVQQFAPGKSFPLAAAKWALQNPAVHSALVGITSYEDLKLYASAWGVPLDDEERRELEAFRERFASSYCRYCGACEGACPQRVAVADIMRYRMYAESYGMRAEARRLYGRLPEGTTAAACMACNGHCKGACPNGLDTRQGLIGAHGLLG